MLSKLFLEGVVLTNDVEEFCFIENGNWYYKSPYNITDLEEFWGKSFTLSIKFFEGKEDYNFQVEFRDGAWHVFEDW